MRKFLAIVVAVGLAACAPTMTAAKPGTLQTGGKFTVALQSHWTQIPSALTGTRGSILTKHGLPLNRVDLITVKDGESLLNVPKNVDAPRFRTGMAAPELVELVTSTLRRSGYADLATENVRPQQIGGVAGIRFNVVGKYQSGLQLRGDVAAAQAGDQLHVLVFVAPARHYYGASEREVDAMISSIAFAGR